MSEKKPLKGLKFRLMPIGDSITTGWPPLENSYRKYLLDSLDGNDLTMVGPTNFGSMHPGERNRMDALAGRRIEAVLESVQKSIPEWKPQVALLHIGTNNLTGEHPDKGVPELMDKLLETMTKLDKHLTILVAGLPPVAFREGNIQDFNKAVKQFYDKRVAKGQRLEWVDMYSDWPDGGLKDFVHPSDVGYQHMAKRWKEGLERANAKELLKW